MEAEFSLASLENRKFLKTILFQKSPDVMDQFEFKKNIYLLSLSQQLLFRGEFYNSLVKEIQKYIKK